MIGQAIADGFLTGSILTLGAIGVSFSMQILRFANFAHSEFLVWGAYLAFTFVLFFGAGAPVGPVSFGFQFLLAIVVASIGTGLVALATNTLVFKPLRRRGAQRLSLVFASFGVALILRNMVFLFWGPEAKYYSSSLQMAVEVLPNVRLMPDQMFVLVFTLILVAIVHVIMKYTRLGIAMRAMAESPALARICGIEVESVIRWTWLIAGMLAAVAGIFAGLTVQMRPEMGFNLLLAILTAAILGGTGSLIGAVVGGFAVGLAENLSTLIIPASYKAAMPFVVLLLVLYLRPQGLFGSKEQS